MDHRYTVYRANLKGILGFFTCEKNGYNKLNSTYSITSYTKSRKSFDIVWVSLVFIKRILAVDICDQNQTSICKDAHVNYVPQIYKNRILPGFRTRLLKQISETSLSFLTPKLNSKHDKFCKCISV